MDKRPITGIKKRQQIQQANKMVFIWVAAAAVAVTVCLVLSQFLVRQFIFNQKIFSAKDRANQTLVQNMDTFKDLKLEVNKLVSSKSLTDLRVAETDTALQVIIDALPTNDDRAALATSLQQIVLARSGVSIESIDVTNEVGSATSEEAVQDETTMSQVGEILFSVTLVGNYDQVKQAVSDMERSIRPLSVDRIQIEGSGAQLRATISAKTYFLPAKTLELGKENITP